MGLVFHGSCLKELIPANIHVDSVFGSKMSGSDYEQFDITIQTTLASN